MLAFLLILTETTWSDELSKYDHGKHMAVNPWSSGKGLERERVSCLPKLFTCKQCGDMFSKVIDI